MKIATDDRGPDRVDYLLALAAGICALAAYVRTLAPDVLYGDSAEFQTLPYTLGMPHSTGYPVYLLLARLLGFLPLGTPAWRVNLLSAVGAAVTVGGVYLLARHLRAGRAGALLGSIVLGLSYAFWAQAVIAEVYTPALAFLTVITLLLWRWQDAPLPNRWALCYAALLGGLGLGVHAFVGLVAPAAVGLVVWTLWSRCQGWPERWRCLRVGLVGLALGVGACFLAFLLLDLNNPPTSFYQVALIPSRSAWNLRITDLDSPFERLWLTILGRQWQDAMFPGGVSLQWEGLKDYGGRLLTQQFSPLALFCALVGLVVALRAAPALGGFVVAALLTMLFFILNYEPPDKPIFFLPTYVLVAVTAGNGAGFVLGRVYRGLVARAGWGRLLYLAVVVLLGGLMARPFGPSRWHALRAGAATFVQEHYPYPLADLSEPRRVASERLAQLPNGAVLIADWRALYTTYYLAHVERERTDVRLMEAAPHGSGGLLADSLVQELESLLQSGYPVYADRVYGNLREHFRLRPVPGSDLLRLSQ